MASCTSEMSSAPDAGEGIAVAGEEPCHILRPVADGDADDLRPCTLQRLQLRRFGRAGHAPAGEDVEQLGLARRRDRRWPRPGRLRHRWRQIEVGQRLCRSSRLRRIRPWAAKAGRRTAPNSAAAQADDDPEAVAQALHDAASSASSVRRSSSRSSPAAAAHIADDPARAAPASRPARSAARQTRSGDERLPPQAQLPAPVLGHHCRARRRAGRSSASAAPTSLVSAAAPRNCAPADAISRCVPPS